MTTGERLRAERHGLVRREKTRDERKSRDDDRKGRDRDDRKGREGREGREGRSERRHEKERRHRERSRRDGERQHKRHDSHGRSNDRTAVAPPRTHVERRRDEVLRDPRNEHDEALFTVDARGDAQVWQFGAVDVRHVPRYERYGNGRTVLGSPRRFVFCHEGSGGARTTFSVDDGPDSLGSVFRDRAAVTRLQSLKTPKTIKTTRTKRKELDEYIAVSKKRRVDDTSSESERTSEGTSEGTDSDSDEEWEGDETRAGLQTKLAELSRRVKDSPEDADAWLALAGLQDEQTVLLARGSDAGPRKVSADGAKGIAAVKVSILESALGHVTDPADRERLQLALVREGAKAWTPAQQEAQWTRLARASGSGSVFEAPRLPFRLWRARLDATTTDLATSVGHVTKLATERMRLLAADGGEAACAELVYVFLRLTRFLYDAGSRELAVAAWQATFETVFARPADDDDDGNTSTLARFWDSEVPRIGDDGALGWRAYASQVAAGEDPELALLDAVPATQVLPTVDTAQLAAELAAQSRDETLAESVALYEAWAAAEHARARLARLPARVLDDMDDGGQPDDARVVLFADVEPLLFAHTLAPASWTNLTNLTPILVDAFLLFCQLPPADGTSSWIEAARDDPFLGVVPELAGASDFAYDGSRVASTPDVLFASRWFRFLPDWLSHDDSDDAPVPPTWIARVLRQLATVFGVGSLGVYSLAVDAIVHPATVKQAARTLVKQAAGDTTRTAGLYEGYALAEAAQGHLDIARGIFASVVTATDSTDSPDAPDDQLHLRLSWAWTELDAGSPQAALHRLDWTSSANTSTTNTDTDTDTLAPADLLRLRQGLQTGLEHSLSTRNLDRAVVYAQTLVLVTYLVAFLATTSGPRALEPVLHIAASVTHELDARTADSTLAHERFLQTVARLVYHAYATQTTHAKPTAFRPADAQAPLRAMASRFPRNGLFLRLFAWLDASGTGVRLVDPVRDLADTLLQAADSLHVHVLLARRALQTSTAAARAALGRTLAPGRPWSACARLWTVVVRLAMHDALLPATRSTGRARIDRRMAAVARDLYYAAVRACPADKAVLLVAFGDGHVGPDTAALTAADLRATVHTMLAKGLRVHLDLLTL